MLSKYAHLVLVPRPPQHAGQLPQGFAPSGAKSDSKDADLILDLLIKHPERLRRLQPDTLETRRLQFLTEERRKLVNQHTSELQRLTNWLKQVFPQILRWFDNPASAAGGGSAIAMADFAATAKGLAQDVAQILPPAQLSQ